MKSIFISFTFIFFSQICLAQLGYFGKKNAVKFDAYFFPAFREDPISYDTEFKGIATTANFNYSRFITPKKSLSVEYSYFKDYMSSSDSYGTTLVQYVNQNSFGLSLKNFRKSWNAPIGSYWVYSLMLNNNAVSATKTFDEKDTWLTFKLGIGYGFQSVIFDKLLIDFGGMWYLDSGRLGISTNKDYGASNAQEVISFRERLRLKMGIGYLF